MISISYNYLSNFVFCVKKKRNFKNKVGKFYKHVVLLFNNLLANYNNFNRQIEIFLNLTFEQITFYL